MAYADALREYEHKRQLGQASAADYDAITNAYNQEYDRYRGRLKLWRVRHYAWEKD